MCVVYKIVVIISVLFISGSLGLSLSSFFGGKNSSLNTAKPVLCGGFNCSQGQYCCGLFNSSCCYRTGWTNSNVTKKISSIINKTGNAVLNATSPVVCGRRTCSQGQFCCGRNNSSCCREQNSTKNVFCQSTNLRMSPSRNCSQGQYCCRVFNTTCCNNYYPKKDVFCQSTNLRMSPSRNCSLGQYCCGVFNTTCCNNNYPKKEVVMCNSTKPWLSPSRNCTRGQYCCGEYNTTCCNISHGEDSDAEEIGIAGLIVLLIIIAVIKVLFQPCSGGDDRSLLINSDD